MKLTILERLVLIQFVPVEGQIDTARSLKDFRDQLFLTEEESKQVDFQILPNGKPDWKANNDPMNDIPIGTLAKAEMIKTLKKMSDDGKLSVDLISCWDKFMADEPENKAAKTAVP